MADIAIEIDEQGADLVIENGDLKLDPGLSTHVLVSLFSDARREPFDPELERRGDDPRGWWADQPEERLGSKLWLVRRQKVTNRTTELHKSYAAESLQWMIDKGLARSITVEASRPRGGVIELSIDITRGTARRWDVLWRAVEGQTFQAPGVSYRFIPY
jgi:phage gp46-like protein